MIKRASWRGKVGVGNTSTTLVAYDGSGQPVRVATVGGIGRVWMLPGTSVCAVRFGNRQGCR